MTDQKPPPRLRRLEIRDFRAIDHLELEFPEPDEDGGSVMVLAGDNGVGKSSVLDAVLLVLGREDLLPSDSAPLGEMIRQGADRFRLEAEFLEDARKERLVFERTLEESRRAEIDPKDQPAMAAAVLTSVAYAVERLPKGSLGPSEFSVESFSSRREPERLGEPVSDPRGARATKEERRLTELKRRLANTYARSRTNTSAFRRVETFFRTFVGERWCIDVIFRDDREGSDPLVVARDGDLPLLTNDTPHTFESIREHAAKGVPLPRVIPIDRLSSGQMAILAMTLPFVFGTRPVDLALIDEPEQHLHPSWQRAFLGALRRLSPSTQFIVATHSPEILSSVATYERRRLVRDDVPSEPLASTEPR